MLRLSTWVKNMELDLFLKICFFKMRLVGGLAMVLDNLSCSSVIQHNIA